MLLVVVLFILTVLSQGRHIHTEWADLAEEMSRVQGAVIVRRPDLADAPGKLAPAVDLDFVQTLHSYFGIFKSSLFPTRCRQHLPVITTIRFQFNTCRTTMGN